MTKFRIDNTDGYSADDLANLNALYYAMCVTKGVDPISGDKSLLDSIAERVQAAYDDSHGSGIVQV